MLLGAEGGDFVGRENMTNKILNCRSTQIYLLTGIIDFHCHTFLERNA